MERTAVAETLEGIAASFAELADVVRRGGLVADTNAGGIGGGVGDAAADACTGAGGAGDAGLEGSAGGAASADPDPGMSRDPLLDPLRDEADAFLDGLVELGRMDARVAALKVHFTAGYAAASAALAAQARSAQERRAHEMAVTAEVACALTVSERTASALLGEAQTLVAGLPSTLAALQAGKISWQHARVLCDETANLDPAAAAGLEAHFLGAYFPDPDAPNIPVPGTAGAGRGCPAGELVPGRFRARARAWRERHHPVSIETRHRRSTADRRVEYLPDRDGMAWLSAYLPADTAAGIWNRTTAAARALQGPDESRTLTQLRADTAAAWLLAGRAEAIPSPAAQVLVTVPVFSLLGAGEEPAMLDGYGPVPASMARHLVADGAAAFLRVPTDPRDGAPLEIGRTSYRLTTPMRQWLRLRDGRCPFPGCNNPSLDNEADHVFAWFKGGNTGVSNLGQPCPKHHRLRHTTAWRPVNATRDSPPGWISPAGRYYPSEQQDWEPPHWPDTSWPANPAWQNSLEEPDAANWSDNVEDPDSPDDPEPDDLGGLDPPPPMDQLPDYPLPVEQMPVDPFPDWPQFTAA